MLTPPTHGASASIQPAATLTLGRGTVSTLAAPRGDEMNDGVVLVGTDLTPSLKAAAYTLAGHHSGGLPSRPRHHTRAFKRKFGPMRLKSIGAFGGVGVFSRRFAPDTTLEHER